MMSLDPGPSAVPRVLSVNVGAVREVDWRGERVRTGIWKEPVVGRAVPIAGVNLAGDDQGDRVAHGGPDKAVYAYAVEDYRYWQEAHGVVPEPGLFGENLTVQGLDLSGALVGERWRVGTALLEVAQPRFPCYKLGIRMGDDGFAKRFMTVGRLGAYLRIVEPGVVAAGDAIEVVRRPAHTVTLRLMAESRTDPVKAAAVQAAPALPRSWRRAASGSDQNT